MLIVSKLEAIEIRKVYPTAKIRKTKNKKYYIPEENAYIKILHNFNKTGIYSSIPVNST